MKNTALIVFLFFTLGIGAAFAQGTEFTYQGSLNNGGTPAAGSYDFEFRLFDTVSGGSQVGSTLARSSVTVTNGAFSVPLDFGSVFPGAPRFLEIQVRQTGGAFTPLTPRQAISTVPYSIKSESADNATNATNAVNATNAANSTNATTATNALSLGGVAANQYLHTDGNGSALTNLNAASITTGTLDVTRLSVPLTLSGTSATHIIRGENGSSTTNASGVFGIATAASGTTDGVYGQSDSTSGRGVYGRATDTATSGSAYGVYGQSDGKFGRGVYGLATDTTGGTSYGVYGRSESPSGIGIFGQAIASSGLTYGMYGVSSSTSGTGVYGEAIASTGTTYGVYGRNASTNSNASAIYGLSTAFTGQTRGVYGQSNSTSGRGVYGSAVATSGSAYGVFGDSASTVGTGVYGNAYATSGTGIGVFGETNTGTGVLGQTFSQGGIAIRAQGSSWFAGNTTPFTPANTGTGTGIVIGSSGNLGFIQAFDYNAFQSRILALNNSGGNVGINTTAPTQMLDVNGAMRVRILLAAPPVANVCADSSNNLVNCATSSLRFKTNVHKYSDGLNILRQLRPISYNWKEGGAYDIGLGAEDVAKTAPFFAFRNKEGVVEGVRYERLSMVLINAVKQQQTQIEAQQKKIEVQNAVNKKQQTELDALKALVCSHHRTALVCKARN